MEFYNLSVREIKHTINLVRNEYNFDLSVYTTVPLRRKLLKLINKYSLKSLSELNQGILEQVIPRQDIIENFQFESTEMFRDPSVWRKIGDILKKNKKITYRILFPNCVDGYELYSLLIILKILGLEKNTEVFISTAVKEIRERIDNFIITNKVFEISSANFKRIFPKDDYILNNFFEKIETSFNIRNVFEIKIEEEISSRKYDMIIYRNKLLYYTPSKTNDIITDLVKKLLPGGVLIIGVNERVRFFKENGLTLLDEKDSFYKKTVDKSCE